jgi:hypothetical protein
VHELGTELHRHRSTGITDRAHATADVVARLEDADVASRLVDASSGCESGASGSND